MNIYKSLETYKGTRPLHINLVASENILPEDAKLPYNLDLLNRYVFESTKQLYFPGRTGLYDLESSCCNLTAELLEAKYVSLKPISGLNAMTCIMGIFTKPNTIIYSINPKYGGHHATRYMLENMGRISRYIPFNEEKKEIDLEKFEEDIKNEAPAMIYIDFMNVLHDLDVRGLRQLIGKRTYWVYDASHVMALIMGKCYKNPLNTGADILIGTTHKTIPGPHKAIFATNNPILNRLFNLRNGSFISSQHPADIYALGIILEGMKESFHEYAKTIISNARRLGSLLYEYGLPVIRIGKDFTDTHQLWIGDRKLNLYPFIDKLIKYKIMTNGLEIPYIENYGIRIGVQEVTFCGFKEQEIEEIALCIGNIYNGTDNALEARIFTLINSMNEHTYFKIIK